MIQQGLLLEVQGSLRLFGGLEQLIHRLQVRLNALTPLDNGGHPSASCVDQTRTSQGSGHFQLASANTAALAWCLAKLAPKPASTKHFDGSIGAATITASTDYQPELLQSLPLHTLDLSPADRQLMMQCGFETVGDLMRQSRDELARRFGPGLLMQFDLLSGKEAYAANAQPEPAIYADQAEMPFHATDQTRIEKVIFQLLCRLQVHLIKTKQRAERLDFQFIQAHAVIPMLVISAQGLQCAKDWALLVHFQLSQLQFKDDVRWIKLRCAHTTPAFDHNGTWLPDPNTDRKQWIELCDKLKARLGEDVVKLAHTIPDPRPELSFEYRTPSTLKKTAEKAGRKIVPGRQTQQTGIVHSNRYLAESAVRPLWLLPTPERLRGKPPNWSGVAEWRLLSGPERIDFGWWGQQACKRDYYRALNKNLTQAWLFCEEELHQGKSLTHWYIHGYFG